MIPGCAGNAANTMTMGLVNQALNTQVAIPG
jgi:hypothetical protein